MAEENRVKVVVYFRQIGTPYSEQQASGDATITVPAGMDTVIYRALPDLLDKAAEEAWDNLVTRVQEQFDERVEKDAPLGVTILFEKDWKFTNLQNMSFLQTGGKISKEIKAAAAVHYEIQAWLYNLE